MAQTPAVTKNDPKIIRGWALFDWANSAFALVITVAIFPGYFVAVTEDQIPIFGTTISNSSLFTWAVSASFLFIAILSPLLSGIADYGGKRKFFLRFFTTLGALSCISLVLFRGMDSVWLGTVSFIVAMIGFAGGLVFYNSYLPDIATEDRYDKISAQGFAYGYVGSVLLLIINLLMVQFPEWFGMSADSTLPARLTFVTVGLWWIGWAQIPFRVLPKDPDLGRPTENLARKGFQELRKVFNAVRGQVNVKRFLLSFFCYSAGVQTVLYLASTFAEKELGFALTELIIVVLILQIVAIGGAYLFAAISERRGNRLSLILMLIIWMIICVVAYFVQTKTQFYGVAASVGLVMGGIQSLSRSTYSKLLPENTPDTTSYFSFYDVLEKVAIVLGTFIFGLFDLITGSMRTSVLILAVFFAVSLVILLRVKIESARSVGGV